MADFGTAGKRTVHASETAATVNATDGEFLICTVDAKGAVPLFTFACTHHDAIHIPMGPPASRYQWSGYDNEHSRVEGDMHVLSLWFTGGATAYRFRMELFDANMALLKTLKDVEYETTEAGDVADEPIRLRTK
jgi:hypothetical protein